MEKNPGKVREFCQSGKVGTMKTVRKLSQCWIQKLNLIEGLKEMKSQGHSLFELVLTDLGGVTRPLYLGPHEIRCGNILECVCQLCSQVSIM